MFNKILFFNNMHAIFSVSFHLENPVIAVLSHKAEEVDTPGVHQLIVRRACHSTGCLGYTGDHTLAVHLQPNTHGTMVVMMTRFSSQNVDFKENAFIALTVPDVWQKSATWRPLSLEPASKHRLRMTPWWSHEGSRTAAHTSCLFLSALELRLNSVLQLSDF